MKKKDIMKTLQHFKDEDDVSFVFKDGIDSKDYRRFEIDFVMFNTANIHLKEIKEE